jgi:hypothetical protein
VQDMCTGRSRKIYIRQAERGERSSSGKRRQWPSGADHGRSARPLGQRWHTSDRCLGSNRETRRPSCRLHRVRYAATRAALHQRRPVACGPCTVFAVRITMSFRQSNRAGLRSEAIDVVRWGSSSTLSTRSFATTLNRAYDRGASRPCAALVVFRRPAARLAVLCSGTRTAAWPCAAPG